jgi:hypothetical protein
MSSVSLVTRILKQRTPRFFRLRYRRIRLEAAEIADGAADGRMSPPCWEEASPPSLRLSCVKARSHAFPQLKKEWYYWPTEMEIVHGQRQLRRDPRRARPLPEGHTRRLRPARPAAAMRLTEYFLGDVLNA